MTGEKPWNWAGLYLNPGSINNEQAVGFPGGAVAENPPANAGDVGLSPGPGRSHILQSN